MNQRPTPAVFGEPQSTVCGAIAPPRTECSSPQVSFRQIYLHCALTGHVFASAHTTLLGSLTTSKWDWIARRTAEEFECDPDDIECAESDERENLTINNKIVGWISEG